MTLIQRSMASAERSFHKSLSALSKLQKARGFVPQETVQEQVTRAEKSTPAGFVPQKTAAELQAFEYMGCFPEDMEEYLESIVDSSGHPPQNIENAA